MSSSSGINAFNEKNQKIKDEIYIVIFKEIEVS
jgi:hypothetical protein